MDNIEMFLKILIFTVGTVALVWSYYPIYSILKVKKKSKANKSRETQVGQALAILRDCDTHDTMRDARAFVELMALSYVLIHILINHGGDYNDATQETRFKKSLTSETMKKLWNVEGKYE